MQMQAMQMQAMQMQAMRAHAMQAQAMRAHAQMVPPACVTMRMGPPARTAPPFPFPSQAQAHANTHVACQGCTSIQGQSSLSDPRTGSPPAEAEVHEEGELSEGEIA